jgi:UDP-N-acetylglucosamine 2-epimerase (non-hydrolysing)
MTTCLACMGTRPEIIKMFPVVRALRERGQPVQVLHTGQHLDMADSLYRFFGMEPEHRLHIQRAAPGLSALTAELLGGIDEVLSRIRPDMVLVQGDTTSALVGALAACFHDVPVAHVEAGLRTGTHDPFPEEKNRELIGRLAQLHFAPTAQARLNLLREGVPPGQVIQVGNTVIDAALWVRRELGRPQTPDMLPFEVRVFLRERLPSRMLLVTAHRRENWGLPMRKIASAVAALLQLHDDVIVIWPMHPNPAVREDIQSTLEGLAPALRARLCLTGPLEYPALMAVLAHCHFTLTDSGGIQEEASALMRPVLVLRESTERQELVEAGGARLVGTEPSQIVEDASLLLGSETVYKSMQLRRSPFGDGHAAERIADVLLQRLALREAA